MRFGSLTSGPVAHDLEPRSVSPRGPLVARAVPLQTAPRIRRSFVAANAARRFTSMKNG